MKRIRSIGLALAAAWTALLLASCAPVPTPSPPDDGQTSTTGQTVPPFYQNLASLLRNEKNSHYFGEIELSVGSKVMRVDDKEEIISSAPEFRDNRLMLPVEAVAKTAGAEVKWNASTSGITINSAYGDTILCSAGLRPLQSTMSNRRWTPRPTIRDRILTCPQTP